MITCYFGVPGCGKTTFLAKFAVRALKSGKYRAVYTNFYCRGCNRISLFDLDQYKLYDSLIILDELALDADNRSFKSFPRGIRDFFVLHRHLGCDIIYATQSFELVDLKIRQLTSELWYMTRSVVPFLGLFTHAKRIYRSIAITEYNAELKLGYRFCNMLERFFAKNNRFCYRPRYYKYFDSFDEAQLSGRRLYESDLHELPVLPSKVRFLMDLCILYTLFHRVASNYLSKLHKIRRKSSDELKARRRSAALDFLNNI